MSTVLRPVGPQPARVYWIRRLLLLLAIVVVAAVVWAIVVGGSGGPEGAAATTDDEPAVTEGGDGGEGEAADDGGTPTTCDPAALTLTLTTDTRTYPAGTQPVFTVGVTNTGGSSCTVDVAAAQREIVITSGEDRIWSSLDCPEDSTESLQLLEAGARAEPTVTWPRIRSAEGCTAGLPEPRPGTYSAVVTMLGATSAAAVFDLT